MMRMMMMLLRMLMLRLLMQMLMLSTGPEPSTHWGSTQGSSALASAIK